MKKFLILIFIFCCFFGTAVSAQETGQNAQQAVERVGIIKLPGLYTQLNLNEHQRLALVRLNKKADLIFQPIKDKINYNFDHKKPSAESIREQLNLMNAIVTIEMQALEAFEQNLNQAQKNELQLMLKDNKQYQTVVSLPKIINQINALFKALGV